MSDELVTRLRGPSGVKGWQTAIHIHAKDAREAADRIEAQAAAIDAALAELNASLFTNAEHQRAKNILRDAREATT